MTTQTISVNCDTCACGGARRLYHGLGGYEAMVCNVCGEHWNARTAADHAKQLEHFRHKRELLRRFEHVCDKCRTQDQAIRLWNWVDHQNQPESLWAIMGRVCPWAFHCPESPNSLHGLSLSDN